MRASGRRSRRGTTELRDRVAAMYEVFSDRARQAIRLADQLAREAGHDRVAAEHILLAILSDDASRASETLRRLNADSPKACEEIRRALPAQRQAGTQQTGLLARFFAPKHLPFTAGAKRVVEYAVAEVRDCGRSVVGTEFLLIGLLQASESQVASVLAEARITADRVREVATTSPEQDM